MRWLAMVVLLCGAQAWARDRSVGECRADIKQFTTMCEKMCDEKTKKNPKAREFCRKACRDQSAKLEKECSHGK